MNMRNSSRLLLQTLSVLALATTLSQASWADEEHRRHHRHEEADDGNFAEVVQVMPIKEQVEVRTPHRECREEEVSEGGSNGNGGAVVGAVAGGLLGHAAGHNTESRKLDTVVGAIGGAIVGKELSKSEGTTTTEERCNTRRSVDYEERTVGYDVTYRYFGRDYHTRMDHDPGDRIRVVVDVHPAE